MDKLAMISILIATVAVPAIFSRDPDGVRGAKRMLLALLVFDALYVAYVTLVHIGHVPQRVGW